MTKKVSNKYQIITSKSGNEYLCSCPDSLSSFVSRHQSPKKAQQHLKILLDYLFQQEPFTIPSEGIYVRRIPLIFNKSETYLVWIPSLLPGIRSFGYNLESALRALSNTMNHFFLDKANTSHQILWGSLPENNFQATCPTLLPDTNVTSSSKTAAVNEMVKIVTDQMIERNLKKQAEAPIIITGAFHSGTSALATLLLKNHIFMGDSTNYALDETEISSGFPGVGPFAGLTDLIQHYYPDAMDKVSSAELLLLQDFFFRLIKDKISFPNFGWKSPLAIFLMPLLAQVFPKAKFLHIVRDGRDVALSPHGTFPNNDLGKLLYFDKTDIDEWNGIKLTRELGRNLESFKFKSRYPTLEECKLLAHLWQKMSTIGAEHGKTLGNRYHQVYYEDLCLKPENTVTEISNFLGIPLDHSVVEWKTDRVEKYKTPDDWASQPDFVNELEKICRTGLESFGYKLNQ